MPKYKSVIVREPRRNEMGEIIPGVANAGETAWIPENDAAKCTSIVQKAIDKGLYKPSSPTEREDLEKAMRAKEIEYIRRTHPV